MSQDGPLPITGSTFLHYNVRFLRPAAWTSMLCCCSIAVLSDSASPWTAVHQYPLSSTISQSWLKFMSIELVMLSNHLMFCRPFSSRLQSFPALGSFPWVDSASWRICKGLQLCCHGFSVLAILLNSICLSFRVTTPNYHNWVTYNNRNVFSHSSGGRKSAVQVMAGLVPSGSSENESVPCLSPGLQHSLTCVCIAPVSAFTFPSLLLFLSCLCLLSLFE